jgi:hypothetical protein
MKTVKLDCSPHPDKFVNVEIPDGAICKYGDKDEKVEIGKRKYRVIKVFNKDGEQIGIVDRLTAKYVYVAPVTEPIEDKPVELRPIKDETIETLVEDCCNLEPPYRQKPITEEEIKEIEKPCCKPIGPQEPIKIKEGKIKAFFKRLFGKK